VSIGGRRSVVGVRCALVLSLLIIIVEKRTNDSERVWNAQMSPRWVG